MVRVIARISSNDDAAAQLRQVLKDLVGPSRDESECLSYELLQDAENLLDFVTIEQWTDKKAADAHLATAHVAEAFAKAHGLLARPPIIHRLTQIALAA